MLFHSRQDSFESTGPFEYGGSYYLIPSVNDLGIVVSSIIFGYLSDRVWFGRKKSILCCSYLAAVGSMLKFFAQDNFGAFLGANFATGLVGGSLAVGLAYVTDLSSGRLNTDTEIGMMIAISLMGRTGGGILAIALQRFGLFVPLWGGVAISIIAGTVCHIILVEPSKHMCPKQCLDVTGRTEDFSVDSEEEVVDTEEESDDSDEKVVDIRNPTVLDKRTLLHIMLGELADNLGSIGLVPLCLSPLLFRTFYAEFVEQGLEPIMSSTSYKWIYIFVASIVLPGAAIAPTLFLKFGPALSCTLANMLTGAVIVALLQIGSLDPPTFATYCIFVTVLYVAFPFTVISQLSTAPMMDRITPLDQRGYVQGLNMATMNLASAVGPFLYSLLYDYTNIHVTLYTAVGISGAAAIINSALIKDARFGPELSTDAIKKEQPAEQGSIIGEIEC